MKTNEEVLQMVQEERSLMAVIWKMKNNWIRHIGPTQRRKPAERADKSVG